MKRIDLTGRVFSRLTVVEMVYGGKGAKAKCACVCGRTAMALAYNLSNGNTKSCGCLAREVRSARGRALGPIQGKKNATHGMSKTKTYASWLDARKRCFDPKNKRFKDYGGRGISMCDAWRYSFEAFMLDMGKKQGAMTLERLDVNGDYEPANCVWATKAQQAQNQTRTKANWEIVRQMRAAYAAGETSANLAKKHCMSWSNAKYIVTNETWKE